MLQTFTDVVPQAVDRRLRKWRGRYVESWMPWACVIALGVVAHHVIVWLLMLTAAPR